MAAMTSSENALLLGSFCLNGHTYKGFIHRFERLNDLVQHNLKQHHWKVLLKI